MSRTLIPIGHELYGLNVYHDGSINTESITTYFLTVKSENEPDNDFLDKNPKHVPDAQNWLEGQVNNNVSPIFPNSSQNFNAQLDSKNRGYFYEFKAATRQLNAFHSDKPDLALKGFNKNITLHPTLLSGKAKISRKTVPKNELLSFKLALENLYQLELIYQLGKKSDSCLLN